MSGAPAPLRVQAPTPWGALHLSLPISHEAMPADAIGTALALQRCEPLLRALEDWLGCALDPGPDDSPAAAGPTGLCTDDTAAPAGTQCRVPWAALLHRPGPPEALRTLVHWRPLLATLAFADYANAPVPGAASPAGGMLLLPASFDATWAVRLNIGGHALSRPCTLQVPNGRLYAAGPAQPAAEAPPRWRVVLSEPINVSLPWLLGWHADALPLDVMGAAACLHGPGGKVPGTEGTVVPAFNGAGLQVGPGDTQPMREL